MEFLVGRNNSDFSFIFHNCHSYYIKKWTRAFKCFIVFFNGRVMCYFVMLLVVYCECWLCGLASMNTDTHENTDTHDCVQLNKWTDPHPIVRLDYFTKLGIDMVQSSGLVLGRPNQTKCQPQLVVHSLVFLAYSCGKYTATLKLQYLKNIPLSSTSFCMPEESFVDKKWP